VLGPALLGLALVVLLLVLALRRRVARHAGHGAAERAAHAVRDARAKVVELALGLLLLALEVLLAAGLLEGLPSRPVLARLSETRWGQVRIVLPGCRQDRRRFPWLNRPSGSTSR